MDTWSSARYARHETIVVNRWWRKVHETQLITAKAQKAIYEEAFRKKAAGLSTYPADAAQAAELQGKIDNTAKDIDAIIARVPTEIDCNKGLQVNADVLHDFDQLRNGANRRRSATVCSWISIVPTWIGLRRRMTKWSTPNSRRFGADRESAGD